MINYNSKNTSYEVSRSMKTITNWVGEYTATDVFDNIHDARKYLKEILPFINKLKKYGEHSEEYRRIVQNIDDILRDYNFRTGDIYLDVDNYITRRTTQLNVKKLKGI